MYVFISSRDIEIYKRIAMMNSMRTQKGKEGREKGEEKRRFKRSYERKERREEITGGEKLD